MVTVIYKIGSENWTSPPPKKKIIIGGPHITILARFRTTLQLNRWYLRNETRYRRMENCDLCYACVLNLDSLFHFL